MLFLPFCRLTATTRGLRHLEGAVVAHCREPAEVEQLESFAEKREMMLGVLPPQPDPLNMDGWKKK